MQRLLQYLNIFHLNKYLKGSAKPYQLNLIQYLNIIMLILLHIFNMIERYLSFIR